MTDENNEAGARLLTETYNRWANLPPLRFEIGHIETHCLIMACQSIIGHPGCPTFMAEALEALGRQFQERVCDTPEIYAMTEAGWHREYDVPRQKGTPECP
ncbi:MAG: hypothetical protein ACJ786_36015 [Catenulispora sp.]